MRYKTHFGAALLLCNRAKNYQISSGFTKSWLNNNWVFSSQFNDGGAEQIELS